MFKTRQGHFWITFDNGYTVSVFNGDGSYSSNQEDSLDNSHHVSTSTTCEVAVLCKGGFSGDLLGWNYLVKADVTPAELLEILEKVKNFKGNKGE